MGQKNLLLLFCDQLRFDAVGAMGNPVIQTPNLDWLCRNGTMFTRCYTPCPVCVPARYAMHTGLSPAQTGSRDNEPSPNCHPSFMNMLQDAGFQTYGVGKMHFVQKDRPFTMLWGLDGRDVSEGGDVKGNDFRAFLRENGYGYVREPNGVCSEMYYIPQVSQLPARLNHSYWVADRSIDYLQRRDPKRPFFLMTSFIKPHPPFEAPVPWNKMYRGPDMPLPKVPVDYEALLTYWNKYQNRYKFRDQGVDLNLVRQIKALYYASISFMDYNIGRLLGFMREEGLMKDTVIVFSSDHGEMLGDYNSFGKRCFFDSAARVPLIVYDPDRPGGVCGRTASLLDIAPTLLARAGLNKTADMQGVDLYDLAEGRVEREGVAGQFRNAEDGMYMWAEDRLKYVYSAPDGREYLFDAKVDPQETRNLVSHRAYAKDAARMRKTLIARLTREGEHVSEDGETWIRYPRKDMPVDPDEGLLFQEPADSVPTAEFLKDPRI